MTHRLRAVALAVVVSSLPAIATAQGAGRGGVGSPPGGPAPLLPPMAPQAPPVPGSAAISGVVLDGATKAPIGDATVYLSIDGRGTVGSQSRQLTDPKGRFVFTNLPAGSKYTITATRFGYLDGGYNRDRMPGASAGFTAVQEGEWISDLRVTMWRPGAIGGTVLDERGEPVAGVFVRTLSRIRIQGRDELAAGTLTTTDDRGMYRIAGLVPGRYLVQVPSVQAAQAIRFSPASAAASQATATAPNLELDPNARLILRNYPTPPPATDGRTFTYPPVFYPGTPALSGAAAIDLRFGEDRGGIDISLQPVPAARISGMVEGPPEALAGLTLRLLPEGLDSLGYGSEAATAMVGADARFTFLNVAAGRYTIDAPRSMSELTLSGPPNVMSVGFGLTSGFPPPPGTNGWSSSSQSIDSGPPGAGYSTRNFRSAAGNFWGRATVAVSGRDETDVIVTMRPLGIMSGRIIVESDPARPAPATQPKSLIHLEPAGGQPGLGVLRTDFAQDQTPSTEFRIQGLQPGNYVLHAGGDWIVKSIMWKGRDYANRPFDAAEEQDFSGVDITVTSAGPVVTGKVHDAQGAVATGARVWFFSVDPAERSNDGFSPQRVKSSAVDHDGGYRIASLPAGQYFAIAVADAAGLSFDEESFKNAERQAARVTLAWSETRTLDLNVSAVR